MTEDAGPRITGIHHVSVTVTDVEASVAWYQRLFGMDRIPFTFRPYGNEDSGYGAMLLDPHLGIGIGLDFHQANKGEAFDECRTGLDHLSFGVASRDELAAWAARLDELGHPAHGHQGQAATLALLHGGVPGPGQHPARVHHARLTTTVPLNTKRPYWM